MGRVRLRGPGSSGRNRGLDLFGAMFFIVGAIGGIVWIFSEERTAAPTSINEELTEPQIGQFTATKPNNRQFANHTSCHA
jgi:hypothetical protein